MEGWRDGGRPWRDTEVLSHHYLLMVGMFSSSAFMLSNFIYSEKT